MIEEGLEQRWARHQKHHLALVAGLESLGLRMHVKEGFRLWSLNTVQIPPGIDDGRLRGSLLSDFDIEIGGGLGSLAGKVWRIGTMGINSSPQPILFFLHALEKCLVAQGFSCSPGSGLRAAGEFLADS